MYGEAHDVVVAAVDTFDGDGADPFLDAVGAGLVEGVVGVDVVADVFRVDVGEGDVGEAGEALLPVFGGDCHAGAHRVGLAGEFGEHVDGLLLVAWFAVDFAVEDDNGVGCDDEFVVADGVAVGGSLFEGDIFGYFVGGEVGGIVLVDVFDRNDVIANAEHR